MDGFVSHSDRNLRKTTMKHQNRDRESMQMEMESKPQQKLLEIERGKQLNFLLIDAQDMSRRGERGMEQEN